MIFSYFFDQICIFLLSIGTNFDQFACNLLLARCFRTKNWKNLTEKAKIYRNSLGQNSLVKISVFMSNFVNH